LFLDELYPGKNKSVKDPWYGTYTDYEDVFEEINEVCDVIIEKYK
jgi:protein-tyrosine-phosphatase